MATAKKKQPKRPLAESDKFDFRHHVGMFDLGFLKPQQPPMSYQNELLTAEEKAAYYDDLIQNNGFENSKKIARDCMKKAGILMKKVDCLDEDEGQPLRDKIVGLVSLANDYSDPVPPDVLASQKSDDDVVPKFPLTPDLKNSLAELGLPGFKPVGDSDAAGKVDADANESKKIKELRRKARFWKNIHAWSPRTDCLLFLRAGKAS